MATTKKYDTEKFVGKYREFAKIQWCLSARVGDLDPVFATGVINSDTIQKRKYIFPIGTIDS